MTIRATILVLAFLSACAQPSSRIEAHAGS